MQNKSKKNGFTLVELLVVATILALLAAAGLVSYTTANRNARNAKRKSDLEQVRAALELFRTENPCYPGSGGSCNQSNNWSGMITALQSGQFITNSQNVGDPKSSPYPQYTYSAGASGGCSAYQICADLEPSANYDYCLCNP